MITDLRALGRLVAIADHGTLQAAATSLSLTQPALTRSVKLLEEALGGQLFERHPRGLRLTPLGERACQHARHLLRESQLAGDDLASLSRGGSGSLRLAGAPVWMSTVLPIVVAQLQQIYPELQLQLVSGNYTVAMQALENGALDIYCGGFQHTGARSDALPGSLPGFLSRQPLFRTRLAVVAAADHPIFDRALTSLTPLLDWPWVSYLSDQAYLDTLMRKVEADTGERREAAVQCDSMLMALNLLRGGRYLAFLPSSFIASVPDFALRVLDTPLAEVGFDSGIIYRTSLERRESLSAFRRLATERIDACRFEVVSGRVGAVDMPVDAPVPTHRD